MKKTRHKKSSSKRRRGNSLNFATKVLTVVRRIPRGRTLSYKEVARRAGNPHAARAVGTLMAHNYDPKVPCHRVICSDGRVGEYNRGGPSRKVELLLMEARGR